MPTRLLLVRHGAVEATWRGRFYGNLDVPLSPEGEREAQDVAARVLRSVKPDRVVSSGLSRAAYGAAAIASPLGLEHVSDDALRELDRGVWAGLSREELEARDPGAWARWYRRPDRERPERGESLRDLARRVLPRLDHWSERTPDRVVVIVAHLWVLRVAVAHTLGLPLAAATRLAVPTGELVVLDWPTGDERDQQRPTLAGFATDAPPRGRGWYRGPHRSADA